MHSKAGISGVVDLLGNATEARVIDVDGCTNIISPRTAVPGVFHTVKTQSKYVLATRVWGVPFKGGDEGKQWVPRWREDAEVRYGGVEELVKDLGIAGVFKL
jgi:hypothetical protein